MNHGGQIEFGFEDLTCIISLCREAKRNAQQPGNNLLAYLVRRIFDLKRFETALSNDQLLQKLCTTIQAVMLEIDNSDNMRRIMRHLTPSKVHDLKEKQARQYKRWLNIKAKIHPNR